jgi:light-regulated signal transduction histidine kinase (bacteriophytochrome)
MRPAPARTLSLVYVAVAALLLPLSDLVLYRQWPPARAGELSLWKGVAFILVSAVCLYFERRRSEERYRAMRETVERQAAELEARVKDRTAELERSQAELEAFSYSVSHDLRAPLRAVEGFSKALLEDYGERLDDTGRDYAGRLVGAAHNMDALIRDLLAYSHLSRAEMPLTAVNLGEVVAEALKAMDGEILEKRARVAVEPDMPSVMAHPTTLVQVVLNLLRNGVKFVPAGEVPRVKVYANPQAGRVRLYVRDNGIGIDVRHQERIFVPFERLHGADAYPGTGIGLSIVRRGVERMEGRVGVISSVGEGSRFWIELKSVK